MPKYPSPSGGSSAQYHGPGTTYKKHSKVGAGQAKAVGSGESWITGPTSGGTPTGPISEPRTGSTDYRRPQGNNRLGYLNLKPPGTGQASKKKGGKAAAAARLANLQKGRAKAAGKRVGAGQGPGLPPTPPPPMGRAMGPTGTNPPPPLPGPAGPMAPSGLRQNATAAIGRPGVPSPAPTVRAPSAALPAPGTASAVAPPGGSPVRGRMPPPRPPGMGQGKATGRGQGRRTTKKSAPGGRY